MPVSLGPRRARRAALCPAALAAALGAAACSGGADPDLERAPEPVVRDLARAGWAPDREGLWSALRPPPGSGAAERAAGLESIGYADGYLAAPEERGVTLHDPARAFAGYNLAVSGHAPAAQLLDMQGRVVHSWSLPYDEVPGAPAVEDPQLVDAWRYARLLPGGELLALYEGHALVKLDRSSHLLWAYNGRAHHALDVGADGSIYALARRAALVPWVHPTEAVLADSVVQLSPEGQVLREVSVLGCFERSPYRSLVENRTAPYGDVLHTNAVVLLDGSLAEDMPAFRRGNVLISMRHTHALAVLDLDAGTVTWAATGMWKLQHDPRVLPNGRILLFDNAGYGWSSQVIEVEPRTARIAWAYRGSPPESFFSLFCGAAQRLPNGNTLITESCQGRAFEVTRAGETVWSYRNPERAGPRGELIAALLEVERVPAAAVEDWLGR
jgi:hypothetical protein